MLNNSLGNWFMLNELFLISLPLFEQGLQIRHQRLYSSLTCAQ
jgi:hypothetical protein